jgi:hypothetical protein
MDGTLTRDLDPLDLEVLERALASTPDVIKSGLEAAELESDEELERALRRELAEMIRASGESDPDALLDMLMKGTGQNVGVA